jgi:flagellar hook-associated protein 2
MPVTMSGMASGIDTDAIIDKLLKVEGKPIEQLEIDKKKNSIRADALKILDKKLKNLNKAARELYGFRASYDEKAAISSDPGVLKAIANKNALKGMKKIEVLQIASAHKISSDPVKEDTELPAGKIVIEVNGESYPVKFRGGSLKSLREAINESASESVDTSTIRTEGNMSVLTLESKTSGKKGEIKIKGDKNLLKVTGLVDKAKLEDRSEQNLVFDKRYFTSYMGEMKLDRQSGNLVVRKDGKSVNIKGLLWQEYALPVQAKVKKDTVFEFTFKYNAPKKEEEKLPFRMEMGPEEEVNVKGIVLKGYNISRLRSVEKKKKKIFESLLGVGVISDEKGKRFEKIYPLEKDARGKQEIPVGKDFSGKTISKIIFYCNEGNTDFLSARLVTPVESKKGYFHPKNEIAKGKDAKLKVDGIKLTRDRNNDLNDVIKGVTLDLRRASKVPIELKVEADTKKSIDRIKKFVEAYNEYIDYNRDITKSEKIDRIRINDKSKHKRGIFVGDMMIIRLENALRRAVGGAYSTRAVDPIKMLPQMGVSTGDINADWETIKEGKLNIDETKLEKTIVKNPEGVKMFFGSDTDGDNRIDTGMAYTVVSSLKPYVSTGRNIISSKIRLEKDSIRMADERIGKHRDHLKSYEQKLRRKFGKMEQAISGAKSQQNWMKNYSGGGEQGKK